MSQVIHIDLSSITHDNKDYRALQYISYLEKSRAS